MSGTSENQNAGSRKLVNLHCCRRLALLGRHRSPSVIAHQHEVEFFFLIGALVVTLGLGFLLLLFFVRVTGAP